MTRKLTPAALLLVLAACGGGSGGNAALTQKFTYATPTAASPDQVALIDAPLTDAVAFQGTQDASAAGSFTDPSHFTDALFGSATGLALDGTTARTALTMARQPASAWLTTDLSGFDDPTCVVKGTARVDFNRCTVKIADTGTSGTIGVNGFVDAATTGQLGWDLTISVSLTIASTSGSGTITAALHRNGHLALTSTTIDGQLLSSLAVSVSAPGQSASLGVDEAVTLDKLTYQTTPTRCITGGTLTASRAWTKAQVPAGTTLDTRSRSAVITWTGCGTGNIAVSNG